MTVVKKDKWNYLVAAIAIASFTRMFFELYLHPNTFGFDFLVYYYAPLDWLNGINPYSGAIRYAWPPFLLPFFGFFTRFYYETVYQGHILIKFCMLAYLLYLWTKIFLKSQLDGYFLLFALLAYNCSIYQDLRVGNISIVEEFFLWTGFYFFLKKKALPFCICILLASICKQTPIFFLSLLLFSEIPKRYWYFAFTAIAFVSVIGLTYLYNPSLTRDFFVHAQDRVAESRELNPTLVPMLKEMIEFIFSKFNLISASKYFVYGLYGLFAMFNLYLGLNYLKNLEKKGISKEKKEILKIFLFTFVYAMTMPRFKDYMYILMIPSTYYVIRNCTENLKPWILLFMLFLFTPNTVSIAPWFNRFFDYFWGYSPYFIVTGAWFLFYRAGRYQVR